jgi:sulfur transfer protein SufE
VWRQLLEYGKQLLALTRTVEQHQADIKEIQSELKEMRTEIRAL